MSGNSLQFSYSKTEGLRLQLGGKLLFLMMFMWTIAGWSSAAYLGYNLHFFLEAY